MIHADSRATNLVDQKMMYVAISRAKSSAAVYTDNPARLIAGINDRAGLAQTSLESLNSASTAVVKTMGAAR